VSWALWERRRPPGHQLSCVNGPLRIEVRMLNGAGHRVESELSPSTTRSAGGFLLVVVGLRVTIPNRLVGVPAEVHLASLQTTPLKVTVNRG